MPEHVPQIYMVVLHTRQPLLQIVPLKNGVAGVTSISDVKLAGDSSKQLPAYLSHKGVGGVVEGVC